MKKVLILAKWGVVALLVSSLSSCEDILEQYFPKPTHPPFPSLGLDIPFYALSGGTRLDAYSTKAPGTRSSTVSITGLQSGERILAIDFRPATGQLYGVSSASRLYVINQNTGVARAIGAGAFTPAVSGNLVSFDFNPTVDRIRLVTSTGQNLRLNPETGAVAATDGAINGAAGATLTGVAYTNNTAGASTTALYAINTQNKQLYLVNPPNDGTVVPVGNLNLNVAGDGGFDIDAKTGTALGLYAVQGKPTLFAVDLATGAARPLAQYAVSLSYSGIAIPTRPVAYGISGSDMLIFDLSNPSDVVIKPITGLQNDEQLEGLDFRPANGQLYAVSVPLKIFDPAQNRFVPSESPNRLYTLNAATSAATLVATLNIRVANTSIGGLFNPAGFDFNPVEDNIRFILSLDNYRINPVDATVIIDKDLNFNPNSPNDFLADQVTAAAYDNNFAGAQTTNLFVINERTRSLRLLDPANEGKLNPVSRTNFDAGGRLTTFNGFDIGGMSNKGYFITQFGPPPRTNLVSINLQDGTATVLATDIPFAISGFTVGLGF